MSSFNDMAEMVFHRDICSCTSCGAWLDDAQPSGYADLMYIRASRPKSETALPSNYLTVCHGCQIMLDDAFRFYGPDPHNPMIRQVYSNAGFFLGIGGPDPEDVPVWIELPGGPIWFRLTADGRRVVTTERG